MKYPSRRTGFEHADIDVYALVHGSNALFYGAGFYHCYTDDYTETLSARVP
jgi:hypothetical protein